MLHNETVNVWTHLVGMMIFGFLIVHHFQAMQPSDLYYKVARTNQQASDLGVPKPSFDLRSSWETYDSLSMPMLPASVEEETYYEQFVHFFLHSHHFDDFLQYE